MIITEAKQTKSFSPLPAWRVGHAQIFSQRMPKYFLNEKYSTGLENNFVVCYLETDAHFP